MPLAGGEMYVPKGGAPIRLMNEDSIDADFIMFVNESSYEKFKYNSNLAQLTQFDPNKGIAIIVHGWQDQYEPYGWMDVSAWLALGHHQPGSDAAGLIVLTRTDWPELIHRVPTPNPNRFHHRN